MKNQRWAVLSDTHGEIDALLTALARESLDGIIFLGDHYHDGEVIIQTLHLPGYAVRGNIEYGAIPAPLEMTIPLGNHLLFLCHGHQYQVKNSLMTLSYRARELHCSWALFGHTHTPYLDTYAGITLFNPGSIGRPLPISTSPSWGLLEVSDEGICASHHSFDF